METIILVNQAIVFQVPNDINSLIIQSSGMNVLNILDKTLLLLISNFDYALISYLMSSPNVLLYFN